jgi:hypothetical protein
VTCDIIAWQRRRNFYREVREEREGIQDQIIPFLVHGLCSLPAHLLEIH